MVTGHSVREIAAAHLAGVLSLSDACTLVAVRGRAMQALGGRGSMAAISAPEAEVTAWLDQAAISGVVVSAVNGPGSVVVSGSATAGVAAAGRYWRTKGVRVRRLRTSHAFHSPLVEPMLADLGRATAGLSYQRPAIALVCGLTGEPDPELIATPGYWVRQACEPVRFADSVRWLAQAGARFFAEIGPDGTLSALGSSVALRTSVWVPVLRTRRAEPEAVLTAAAELFAAGVGVDWAAMFGGSGTWRADLPTYAFQRQRYWPTPRPAGRGALVAGRDGAEAGFWAAVEREDTEALAEQVGVRGHEPLSVDGSGAGRVAAAAAAAVTGGPVALPVDLAVRYRARRGRGDVLTGGY